MWSLVTLNEADIADAGWTKKRETASTFLSTAADAKSTEWWAVKLLLDSQGSDPTTLDRTRKQLLKTQHEDGGWGWLSADDSDAFGTGLAIYSLCQSGLKGDDPVIARACSFLVKSQQKNGSWTVNGTKKNAANRVTPTATY
jgi:squalene cyclase